MNTRSKSKPIEQTSKSITRSNGGRKTLKNEKSVTSKENREPRHKSKKSNSTNKASNKENSKSHTRGQKQTNNITSNQVLEKQVKNFNIECIITTHSSTSANYSTSKVSSTLFQPMMTNSSSNSGIKTRSQYGIYNSNGKRTRENLKDMVLDHLEQDEPENESESSLIHKKKDSLPEENTYSKSKNNFNVKPSHITKKKKTGGEESTSSIFHNPSFLLKKKKCSICFDLLICPATITTCKHEFCLSCLRSWVDKASTCPMCRENFTSYTYNQHNKLVTVQVSDKNFSDYSIEDDQWVLSAAESCMICKNANNENLLLVCDDCNYNVCHTYCTNMDKIPDGEWLCAECVVIKYSKNIRPQQREKLLRVLHEDSEEE